MGSSVSIVPLPDPKLWSRENKISKTRFLSRNLVFSFRRTSRKIIHHFTSVWRSLFNLDLRLKVHSHDMSHGPPLTLLIITL